MIAEKPGFNIIYGIDNVMSTQLELISNARHRLDMCMDHTQPHLTIESSQLRQRILDNKSKGIKLSFLTEITNDNLYYCKELLSMVDELRHLDSIRGNFYVSEKEYAALAVYHEKGESTDMMIYSGNREVVQHQQHIFENMWNASTSAERKIWEIERNVNLGTTEIIDNPSKTKALFIDLIKSAKFEILLICPTVNAFLREYRIGAIQLFKEICHDNAGKGEEEGEKRKRINIKILTPTNDLVNRIIDEYELTTVTDNKIGTGLRAYSNLTAKRNPSHFPSSYVPPNQGNDHPLQIRFIQSLARHNVTTSTIMVIDRNISLVMEKVDDTKSEFIEAVGLSTYSTSTPTVASYVSIFENFWSQVELYEKLSANERMEKEFINLAAHELRTPAQAILGYTELALMEEEEEGYKDTVDSEKAGYIAAAHRNAQRLQRLTKDILDVARIESNTLELIKERFDLVEKINDAINDIVASRVVNTKTTTANNPEIVFNKPDTALFINADKIRIYEVITILLNNAISATKNNGKIIVSTKVVKCAKDDVRTDDNDNNNENKMCIVVSIRDNGTGIHSEIQTKLFTKFATKSESGLGLGLYISKNIIEAHEGRIWGENNKGEIGATFAFSLKI